MYPAPPVTSTFMTDDFPAAAAISSWKYLEAEASEALTAVAETVRAADVERERRAHSKAHVERRRPRLDGKSAGHRRERGMRKVEAQRERLVVDVRKRALLLGNIDARSGVERQIISHDRDLCGRQRRRHVPIPLMLQR